MNEQERRFADSADGDARCGEHKRFYHSDVEGGQQSQQLSTGLIVSWPEGVGQYTASFGVVSIPEPVLQGFTANKGPLFIEFTDKGYISVSNRRRGYSPGREFFKARMTVLMPIFSVLAVSRTPEPL